MKAYLSRRILKINFHFQSSYTVSGKVYMWSHVISFHSESQSLKVGTVITILQKMKWKLRDVKGKILHE